MITWVPSDSGTGAFVTRSRGQLTDSDMSAAGSRSTIHAVDWRTLQLGELALDPHRAEPVDVLGDARGDGAHRPGVVGRLARLGVSHVSSSAGVLTSRSRG